MYHLGDPSGWSGVGSHSQKSFPYVRLFTMKWVVGTILWTGYQGWVKRKREESRRSSWVSLSRPSVWWGARKGPCAIISSTQHYRLHLSKWKMSLFFPWRTFFQILCHSNCENNQHRRVTTASYSFYEKKNGTNEMRCADSMARREPVKFYD